MLGNHALVETVVGMRESVGHRGIRVLGLKGVVEDVGLSQMYT